MNKQAAPIEANLISCMILVDIGIFVDIGLEIIVWLVVIQKNQTIKIEKGSKFIILSLLILFLM